MLASERLLQIRERFGSRVERLVAVELYGEPLRAIIYLQNDTNLRLTEQWRGETLARCSYYWLSPSNTLKIGWDNTPHHAQLESFPHPPPQIFNGTANIVYC